jgi:3-methyladenine DNA glycosylase Tag
MRKRQRIEAYLAQLDPRQLAQLTAREITAALADDGVEVSERYVARVLDQWTATRRGSGTRRRRR